MRQFIGAALVLVLAAGGSAGDGKKYQSKDGKYAVAFPGEPKTLTQNTKGVDVNIAIVEKGGGGLAVIYSDLPAEGVKKSKPKELLDGGEKGLVEKFRAKVTSSKDIEFGAEKYPARELAAEKDNSHLRITLVLVENRLYQVFAVGPKALVTGKDTDEFFKSFEIKK